MNKNTFELALQNHQKNNLEIAENLYKNILEKEETINVASGILELKLEEVTKIMTPGSTCHIPPGTVHRFCAGRECVTLIEVSTIHLDDVVRLEDDYGRE